jgi:hypothetical protein
MGWPLVYDQRPFTLSTRAISPRNSMSLPRVLVSVLIERTPLNSRWASERWEPRTVELAASDEAYGESGADAVAEGGSRWRFSLFAIELHRSEAEGYFLNVTAPDPKIFVMCRPAEDGAEPPLRPVLVTVSYNEAARMLDGGEQVEAVPMLPEILEWMNPFVAEHYKPEPRKKIRRNDPFAEGAAQGGPRPRRNA